MGKAKASVEARRDKGALEGLMRALRALGEAWRMSDEEIRAYYPLGYQTGGFERLALRSRERVADCLQAIWTVYVPALPVALPQVAVELLKEVPSVEQLYSGPRPASCGRGQLWRETWESSGVASLQEKLLQILRGSLAMRSGHSHQKTRRWSLEDKLLAGKILTTDPGMTYRALAARTGIPHNTLQSWKHLRAIKSAGVSEASRGSGRIERQFTRDV